MLIKHNVEVVFIYEKDKNLQHLAAEDTPSLKTVTTKVEGSYHIQTNSEIYYKIQADLAITRHESCY